MAKATKHHRHIILLSNKCSCYSIQTANVQWIVDQQLTHLSVHVQERSAPHCCIWEPWTEIDGNWKSFIITISPKRAVFSVITRTIRHTSYTQYLPNVDTSRPEAFECHSPYKAMWLSVLIWIGYVSFMPPVTSFFSPHHYLACLLQHWEIMTCVTKLITEIWVCGWITEKKSEHQLSDNHTRVLNKPRG